MEEAGMMMKRQSCNYITNTSTKASSPTNSLGLHRDSQMVSKVKPKIRIIHIFAPEIIKTDVANFRELVQRLTGKPSPSESKKNNTTTNKRKQTQTRNMRPSVVQDIEQRSSIKATNVVGPKKLEIRTGFRPAELRERIKGEEEIWGGANSGGGFLGGFADLDGFMQELTGYPLLPLDANSHMDAFGESQYA